MCFHVQSLKRCKAPYKIFSHLFSKHALAVHIQGGDFEEEILIFSDSRVTTQSTLEFTESNWQIDGSPLIFTNGEIDISERTGLLTGILKDGNFISHRIETTSTNQTLSTIIHLVPQLSETTITPAHFINFQSQAGTRYLLQSTEDAKTWHPASEEVIGTGGMIRFGVSRDKSLEFYRVVSFIE